MNNTDPVTPWEMLHARYGKNPPVQALGRLEMELSLKRRSFLEDTLLVSRLREEAKDAGTDLDVAGNFGASLINWLYGCADVNPLPPHYRCPVCGKSKFAGGNDGWDLPTLDCCGQPMEPDGHAIPLESALPMLENDTYPLQIRLAESFTERAEEIIRDYYKHSFAVIPYETEAKLRGHRFALIPKGGELPPLDRNGVWRTNLEELLKSNYKTIKLIPSDIKEQLRELRAETELEPTPDDLRAKPVMALTEARLRERIEEAGGILLSSGDLSFSSLLKVSGYLRSKHDEDNPVLLQEDASLSDVFTCREEVWYLVNSAMNPEYGLSSRLAWRVMEKTRKGLYTYNRMKPQTEQILRGLGIEERWIEQMKHTYYLPPKADLISFLLDELKLSWYELKRRNE